MTGHHALATSPVVRHVHVHISSSLYWRLFSGRLATGDSMATAPTAASISGFCFHYPSKGLNRWQWNTFMDSSFRAWRGRSLASPPKCARRRTSVYAVNQDAEKSFKKTLEVDRLIDTLRVSNPGKLEQLVVENVLAFNESFWIRLAARTDTCKSDDDKEDYEDLAASVMSIIDRLVHKTNEKIESSTDILKAILRPVLDGVQEVSWPPRDPESLKLMKEEVQKREHEGQLDEGFLAEVNAQLRQVRASLHSMVCKIFYAFPYTLAKEDGDKPGLVVMLQKVLQLYASIALCKRSYAYKGGEVVIAEKFLESIIEAPEESWNKLLIEGLTLGKGEVSPEKLKALIKKRIERVLIRTGAPTSSVSLPSILRASSPEQRRLSKPFRAHSNELPQPKMNQYVVLRNTYPAW